jgi:putative flippase GtrA
MTKRVASSEVETLESLEPVLWVSGSTQPMPSLPAVAVALAPAAVDRPRPSYRPTQWQVVNRALDVADGLTGGRADWIQRLVSYLFVGGCAAGVNLLVFNVMYYHLLQFADADFWQKALHFLLAFVVATELSIIANFIPNDYLTFRHLPGHQRSWLARGARYHVTCIAGTLLTLLISGTLQFFIAVMFAQAVALVLVTAFNFVVHHAFTYSHKAH